MKKSKETVRASIKQSSYWKWRKVINGIMAGKNRYEAYAIAYELPIETQPQRDSASASCSELLRNPKFKALWREILEERGFNEEDVDTLLIKHMLDPDPQVSLKAIDMFNKLLTRYQSKMDITSDGEKVNVIIGGEYKDEPKFRVDNRDAETDEVAESSSD